MPSIYFEELFDELGVPRPQPALYTFPDWFKDMPRYFDVDKNAEVPQRWPGTIKACPAVHDSMAMGYTLFLPADVWFDATGNDVRFDIGDFGKGSRIDEANFPFVRHHDKRSTSEYRSMFDFHEQSMKWHPYWGVRTDEGYSTLFTHPIHRNDLPFQAVTAIVDTDQMAARSPFAFFIKKGFKGVLQRGTPIMQVVPFRREDWEMKIVPPDGKDYHRKQQLLQSTFTQPYKKLFWQRKKFK